VHGLIGREAEHPSRVRSINGRLILTAICAQSPLQRIEEDRVAERITAWPGPDSISSWP
jgi:hypothetical protein